MRKTESFPKKIDFDDLLLQHIRETIFVWKIDGDPSRLTTSFVSDNVEQLLGYKAKDFIDNPGLWLSIIHPEDAREVEKKIRRILSTGSSGKAKKPLRLTYRIRRRRTRDYRWIEDVITPQLDVHGRTIGLVGSLIDITERVRGRKQEVRGKKSEGSSVDASLTSMFEKARVGVYRTTPDGRILYANRALVKMLGFKSSKELKERNVSEEGFGPRNSRDDFLRCINKEGVVNGFESVWKRKDGSLLFVRENARIVRDRDKSVLYYEGTVEDLTEVRLAQERIIRLNQILRTLSNIDQLIVRNTTPEVLFNEACAILVRDGKYLMAWVGVLDQSGKVVHPIAWSGVEGGIPKETMIASESKSKDLDLIEEALRTGLACVCNDLLKDTKYRAWRSEASKRGYRSAGAFPIRVSDKVVGVVNVFAGSPNGFSSEEIRTLSALAGDIGFALWTIEARAKEKSTYEAIKDREFWLSESQRVARIGSYVFDVKSGTYTSSPTLDEIFGIDPGFKHDLDTFMNIVHPEDRQQFTKYLEEVLSEKKPFTFEHRIVRPSDKAERWMWSKGELMLDTAGEPTCMFGTIQDITDRKLAEETQDRERILLRTLIDNLPSAVFVKDNEYRKTVVNSQHVKAVAAHLGSLGLNSPKDVLGKTDFDLYPRDLAERYLEEDRRIIRDGDSILNKEVTVVNADGRKSWLLESKVPLRDKDGRIKGLIGIMTDITAQKEAEELAKQERILFRTVIDNIPHSIYVKDTSYRKIIANPENLSHTGMQAEAEVFGKTDFDLFPKEMAARFFVDDQTVIKEGKSVVNREEHLIEPNGRLHWLLTTKVPLRNENGTIRGLVGIGIDVTERKQAEEALERERILLRTLIDNLPFAVYVKDANYRKVISNPADVHLCNCSREEEVIGKTDFDFYPRELAEQYFLHDQKVIVNGETVVGSEGLHLDSNGNELWILTTKVPLRSKTGDIIGLVGVGLDVTEQKKLDTALRQSENELRSLFASMKDVVIVFDKNGKYLRIAPTNPDLLYRPAQELIGKTCHEVFSDQQADEFLSAIRRSLDTGELQNLEYKLEINGRETWFDGSFSRVEEDKVLLVARDVTAHRRAEEALQKSEATLKQIMESIEDAIYSIDGQTAEFTYLSPVFERKLGYSPSDIKKMGGRWTFLKQIVKSDNSANLDPVVTELQKHVVQEIPVLENWWRCKDGTLLYIQDQSVPTYDGDKLVRIDGVLRDITKWKLSEDSKQRERILLRTMIDNMPYGIYVKDKECRKVLANPADVHNMGCQLEAEVLGKTDFDFYPKEIADNFFADDQAVIQEGKTVSNREEYFYDPDGKKHWLWTTKVPLRDETGRIIGLVGIGANITERKAIEEALRQSEAELRALFESMKDVILVLDKDGRFLKVSPTDDSLLYKPASEIAGKTSYEVFPKELAEYFLSIIRKTLESGKTQNVEYAIDICGEERWRAATVSPLTVDTVLWVARDITERKLMEKGLRDSEKKYRELVENALLGVYRTTISGSIVYANKAMADMLEYDSPAELISKKAFDLYKDVQHRESFVEELRIHGRTVKTNEVEWVTKTGKVKNVLLSASLDGEIISGMAKDITEIRTLEREFLQTQKLEGLGNIAAGIAHDFNNILGVILGYADLLSQSTFDPKKFQRGTQAIMKSGERGKSLVKQLLTFARKTETTFGPVEVNEIVSEIEKLMRETFPKTIVITTKLREYLPIISGDASQIHQVLLNICVNARDAMPKGGRFTISTDVIAGEKLIAKFPDAAAKKYVEVRLEDTGTGMSEETRRRIFEPFFTTKEVGKGTGLGLSVAYGIVQSHRGFINVASEPQKATVFNVYFPVLEYPKAEDLDTGNQSMEEISVGTGTVLIIEDEVMLRDLLRTILESKGYRVLAACDGEEGVQMFRKNKDHIAAVLSDLGLPKLSGEETVAFIKQEDPQARVIIASGFIDPDVRSGLEAAGVKDFIQKPYVSNEVLKVVQNTIEKGKT
jgi:PAS domain S-box-containing protein